MQNNQIRTQPRTTKEVAAEKEASARRFLVLIDRIEGMPQFNEQEKELIVKGLRDQLHAMGLG